MAFLNLYNSILKNSKQYVFQKLPYFIGQQAYEFAKLNTTFRQRYSGSNGNLQALLQLQNILLENKVKFKIDSFIQSTPFGKTKFNNLVVDFPSKTNKNYIIIGAHHDTKFLPKFKNFSGANDGASGVGLLLSLILYFNKLKLNLPIGLKFIFFDGEQCFYQYNKNDGLIGSKYAAKLYHHNCKYMLLLDMIGAKNLQIQFPKNCNNTLIDLALNVANENNYLNYFNLDLTQNNIIDDTTPFEKYNIPTLNFIQFNYQYWHTDEDTFDKISLNSLEIVGNIIIQVLRMLFQQNI